MTATAKIDVKDRDLLAALRQVFGSILGLEDIKALLVPGRLPMKQMVMPMLITDPDRLDGITGLHFHTLCEKDADALERTVAAVQDKLRRAE